MAGRILIVTAEQHSLFADEQIVDPFHLLGRKFVFLGDLCHFFRIILMPVQRQPWSLVGCRKFECRTQIGRRSLWVRFRFAAAGDFLRIF